MSQRSIDGPAGIGVARKALLALAEGDEAAAREAISAASHGELIWTSGYLLSCVRDLIADMAEHNPADVLAGLRAAAETSESAAVVLAAQLITMDANPD